MTDKTVLVTGANRGIGRELVEAAARRGAARVYAASRQPAKFAHPRIEPLRLDVTDAQHIARAVQQIGDLDVLINNAGVALYDDLSDRSLIEHHLAINFFGTYDVTIAFLPLIGRSQGAIVNNLSVNALAPLPLISAYSVSKAAALNFTQSLRAMVADQGVQVYAILTGPTDTDMTRGLDIPKASPRSVAEAVFDALERDEQEIFPDPISQSIAAGWRNGAAKTLERQYAELLAKATPVAAAPTHR